MTFEQNYTVSCGRGWTMLGAVSVFECGADGAITGELPQCMGQPCDAIPSVGPLNGEACDNLTTGMQCNVTCKPGYGPNFIRMTCDESNFFVDAIPLCEPAQCPQSPQLQDPSPAHDCEGVTFDQRCSVLCAAGYVLNGDAGEVWRCKLSGPTLELTGTLSDCRPFACPNISSTAGMDSNCTNLVAGQSCQQTCAPGFLPVGGCAQARVACQASPNLHTCPPAYLTTYSYILTYLPSLPCLPAYRLATYTYAACADTRTYTHTDTHTHIRK